MDKKELDRRFSGTRKAALDMVNAVTEHSKKLVRTRKEVTLELLSYQKEMLEGNCSCERCSTRTMHLEFFRILFERVMLEIPESCEDEVAVELFKLWQLSDEAMNFLAYTAEASKTLDVSTRVLRIPKELKHQPLQVIMKAIQTTLDNLGEEQLNKN